MQDAGDGAEAAKVVDVVTSDGEAPAPKSQIMGVPLAFFVRGGGTTTWGHDQMVAAQEADAEARRDQADLDRARAQVPIEEGGAKLYANKLTDRPELQKAYVLLTYLTARGEPVLVGGGQVQCLADVIVGIDPRHPLELTLVLVCPRCKERGVPQGQCQIQIRQTNRNWVLDQRSAGELIVFEGMPYRSAGTVVESEPFKCPSCDWRARIDKNRVWPD